MFWSLLFFYGAVISSFSNFSLTFEGLRNAIFTNQTKLTGISVVVDYRSVFEITICCIFGLIPKLMIFFSLYIHYQHFTKNLFVLKVAIFILAIFDFIIANPIN